MTGAQYALGGLAAFCVAAAIGLHALVPAPLHWHGQAYSRAAARQLVSEAFDVGPPAEIVALCTASTTLPRSEDDRLAAWLVLNGAFPTAADAQGWAVLLRAECRRRQLPPGPRV